MQMQETASLSAAERRQYERYPCPHYAQAFFSSQWRDCAVGDISAGGAYVCAHERPSVGETVMLFVEDVAEMPATVIRHTHDGFALRFDLSSLTRH